MVTDLKIDVLHLLASVGVKIPSNNAYCDSRLTTAKCGINRLPRDKKENISPN